MLDRTTGDTPAHDATSPTDSANALDRERGRRLGEPWAHGRLTIKRGTAVLVLALSMVVLSAALIFDAAAHRYQVTHLAGLYVMRTDRLTGQVDVCGMRSRLGPLVCQSSQVP